MSLLMVFAFLAGIVTILSPCILPVLPIVLAGSLSSGKERPLGIVAGFILSFTFFTLFLTTLVKFFGIPADALRTLSVFVIFFFGLSLIFSQAQQFLERIFSVLLKYAPRNENRQGFGGGFIIGISIGLLWTPCVGPILASVISLALTGNVSFFTSAITLSYAFGTAIPMFIIIYGGQKALKKLPWLIANSAKIQRSFGVVMILVAIIIHFNIDRALQAYIVEKFPNYGANLTKIETNKLVSENLKNLGGNINEKDSGKTTADLMDKAYEAPDLIPGGVWFNLPDGKKSLTLAELRGKVVLIDFWTYTCINCIRTLPYLKDWHEKYAAKGLVIIGVHTPEFEFEKLPANVEKAVKDFDIKYAVMQDNDYATWNAYNNNYWPAEYLIDKDGRIRKTHFGEGEYDQTEQSIQALLAETGSDVSKTPINKAVYSIDTLTPETYLGYTRIENFASPEKISYDKSAIYTLPGSLPANKFAFTGEWNIGEERALPAKGAKLYFDFAAKNVYLVMRPKNENSKGYVKVYLNDMVIDGNIKGTDVAINGIITVDSDRLYHLVNSFRVERRVLQLEFLDDNIEVYAFTFG